MALVYIQSGFQRILTLGMFHSTLNTTNESKLNLDPEKSLELLVATQYFSTEQGKPVLLTGSRPVSNTVLIPTGLVKSGPL